MLRFWFFFLEHRRFTYLLLAALIAAGGFCLLVLPREANPEIKVPIGVVTTVYAGASAPDIERLITDEIEKAVENLEEVDEYTSVSREGVSSVIVNFEADADLDDRIRALRDAVTAAERELPNDAERPVVAEISFDDTPILVFGLAADVPAAELKRIADIMEDELERIAGVADVTVTGAREQEIRIDADKSKLDQFGVAISEIVTALQTANLTFPIGSIQTDEIRYVVRLDAELRQAEEVGNLPIKTVDGVPVYVRDVARVSQEFAPETSRSRVSVHGSPSLNAISLALTKKTGGDITKIAKAAKERVESLRQELHPEAQVIVTFDAAVEVA
jgi:multidrug efflux pump subunit AcrB